MKLVGKIILCTFVLLMGTMFLSCVNVFDKVRTDYVYYTVQPNDTLNEIAREHYALNTKGYIPLDDYQMMVRVANNDKHNFERQLQIGDVVKIPVYTVVNSKL